MTAAHRGEDRCTAHEAEARFRPVSVAAGGLLLALANAGCDDVDWPEPRYIDSLRVLGVRADPPTLTPGATTQLSLACVDGRHGADADPTCDAQVAWFAQCNNPPDNDPERCLERYAPWADDWNAPLESIATEDYPDGFAWGKSASFSAPADILVGSLDIGGRSVRYGTSYVFFMACAGQITPAHGLSDRLPVECRDPETRALLDQRRYVIGVTTSYSYDVVVSSNPKVQAPSFDGVRWPSSCNTPLDCPTEFECSADSQCVPVVSPCNASGSGCSEHCLRLEVAADSFGWFGVDAERFEAPSKSLWLGYYTNAGQLPDDDESFSIPAPADPAGTTRTECVHWQAPNALTEHAHLWAVVRDNRGGLTVWDQRVIVR